jgi:hypothetical protein
MGLGMDDIGPNRIASAQDGDDAGAEPLGAHSFLSSEACKRFGR